MFTPDEVKQAADKMQIDLQEFDLNELTAGANHELEHQDITKGSLQLSIKIALAHMKEIPDYYTRLQAMEKEAKQGLNEGVIMKSPERVAAEILGESAGKKVLKESSPVDLVEDLFDKFSLKDIMRAVGEQCELNARDAEQEGNEQEMKDWEEAEKKITAVAYWASSKNLHR